MGKKNAGNQEEPVKIQCPYCKSRRTNRAGMEYSKDSSYQRFRCNSCNRRFSENTDPDLVIEVNRLDKRSQKFQDKNRIREKVLRESNRIENALEEYNKEIISLLKKYNFGKKIKIHNPLKDLVVGVIQISDLHFNELVNVVNNAYDFNVGAKRLKMYADKIIPIFQGYGVKTVLIADTGDKLNSDRRLDEYLNQSTNRSNATMLAVHLIKQFLIHLSQHFKLSYACVTGNESRVKDEPGYTDLVATDNYDFTIFNILRYMFAGSEIDFIMGDPSELTVVVNGQNVLMIHGNKIRGDVSKTITQIKGKYADKGVLIDYVIFGDVHEARIADGYSRSSSMVGDNEFSFKGLNLTGRASQNIHLFHENRNRDSIKIDLQNTEGVEGYDIIKELEAYNAKSAKKLEQPKTIMKIII